MITKEEWVDWKNNPVTSKYLRELSLKREELKEGLAEGQTGSEREDVLIIGRCQGIKDAIDYALLNFDYFQLEETNGS